MFYCDADPYAGRLVQNVTNHVSQNMLYTIYPNVFNEAIDRYPYPEIIESVLYYPGHDAADVMDKMIECQPEKILKTLLELHPRQFLGYMDAERSLTTICSDLSLTVGLDATASLLLYDRLLLQNYLTGSYPTETEAAIFAFCYNNLPLWDDIVFHSLSECEFKTCLKSKWVEMGLDSAMMLDYARTESWANIVHKLYENGEDSLNYLFAYYYFGEMIELLETWHYLLIGFMNRIESYFGTETRDALDGDTLIAIQYLSLSEYHIYGSSRLGILKMDDTLKKADIFYRVWLSDMSRVEMSVTLEEANRYSHDSSHTLFRGRKMYEGVNHLGNVLVVYSDKRLNVCNADTVTYYRADILQATDYSAFHVTLEEREWYSGNDSARYRFGGSNGQEKDNEVSGFGNSYSAEYWQYDPRLGRRFNVDPLMRKYPGQSPYATFNNNPLYFKDPSGLEGQGGPKKSDEPKKSDNRKFDRKVRKKMQSEVSQGVLNGLITPANYETAINQIAQGYETKYKNKGWMKRLGGKVGGTTSVKDIDIHDKHGEDGPEKSFDGGDELAKQGYLSNETRAFAGEPIGIPLDEHPALSVPGGQLVENSLISIEGNFDVNADMISVFYMDPNGNRVTIGTSAFTTHTGYQDNESYPILSIITSQNINADKIYIQVNALLIDRANLKADSFRANVKIVSPIANPLR